MNKKTRIKLEDWLTGKNVWGNYVFLKDSQWWDRDKMEEYRLGKLIKLLNHCYYNVPAYKHLMGQAGLHPDNMKSMDVLGKLPVINKQYVLDHYNDFIASNLSSIKGVKASKTSGTTGQVLNHMNDANTRSVVWGSFLRFQDWMGRDFNNPYIAFRGIDVAKQSLQSKIKIYLTDIIKHQKSFDSYDLRSENIQKLINVLDENPKSVLRGYVLNIVDLAVILKGLGKSYALQAVSTTAEPLLDFHRKIIEDTFHCGVFDQYGCGEIGGVAYECDHHEGLHITEEHVIAETDTNDEAILTDLDNYCFPLLRYRNGDKLLMSDKACSCGRKTGMVSKVLGRTSDNVIGLDGLPVHWGYFHHVLIYTGIATQRHLVKFQVIQNSKDELIFNLVADELNLQDKKTIIDLVTKKLGNMKISVNNVSEIPNSKSGKFKAIISKLPRQ